MLTKEEMLITVDNCTVNEEVSLSLLKAELRHTWGFDTAQVDHLLTEMVKLGLIDEC